MSEHYDPGSLRALAVDTALDCNGSDSLPRVEQDRGTRTPVSVETPALRGTCSAEHESVNDAASRPAFPRS